MTDTRPTQHPARTSDARKRHAEAPAATALTDIERRALAAASCGNCGERTAVLNLVERIVTDRVNDALDERYAESNHRVAKYWRAKREAEVRAETAEAEVERLRGLLEGMNVHADELATQRNGFVARAETAEAERDEAREILADCNDENAYLREALARVGALADLWEEWAAYRAERFNAETVLDAAAADIRAALTQPATDEGAGA